MKHIGYINRGIGSDVVSYGVYENEGKKYVLYNDDLHKIIKRRGYFGFEQVKIINTFSFINELRGGFENGLKPWCEKRGLQIVVGHNGEDGISGHYFRPTKTGRIPKEFVKLGTKITTESRTYRDPSF